MQKKNTDAQKKTGLRIANYKTYSRMTLTLNQDVMSNKNELYATKGEQVTLISDRSYPVLLVSNSRGQTFSVKAEGTDYDELKKKTK
jgi:hypothetical protein